MTPDTPTRHSIAYFPSREGRILGGHAFLLARDIPLGIMPLRVARDQLEFKVELTPPDEERAAWLTRFLHVGQYERHSLEEAVVDFVSTMANYIAHHGEVHLEILRDETGKPVQLDPLPLGRILRTPRAYLQIIPKRDRSEHGGRRYVSVPRERIWRLGLPRELGTARAHRRLLHRLASLSDISMPAFALEGMDLGGSVGYEFSAHHRAAERLMEKATRRWGTVMSIQRPIEGSTEYFYISRRLAFLKAQALLREHLVQELNRELARLEVGHSVAVNGIPKAQEISETMARLHRGEISFEEALDNTRT